MTSEEFSLPGSEIEMSCVRPAHALRLYHGLARADVATHLGCSTSPLRSLEMTSGWPPSFTAVEAFELGEMYRVNPNWVTRADWPYDRLHAVVFKSSHTTRRNDLAGFFLVGNAMVERFIDLMPRLTPTSVGGATLLRHQAYEKAPHTLSADLVRGHLPRHGERPRACRAQSILNWREYAADMGFLVQPVETGMRSNGLALVCLWSSGEADEKYRMYAPPVVFYCNEARSAVGRRVVRYVNDRRTRMVSGSEVHRLRRIQATVKRVYPDALPSNASAREVRSVAKALIRTSDAVPIPYHIAETCRPHLPQVNAERVLRSIRRKKEGQFLGCGRRLSVSGSTFKAVLQGLLDDDAAVSDRMETPAREVFETLG